MDMYSKAVLTVIAGALVALVAQGGVHNAIAQSQSCGGFSSPCFVKFKTDDEPCRSYSPCTVVINR
jgi:hypothetical protein